MIEKLQAAFDALEPKRVKVTKQGNNAIITYTPCIDIQSALDIEEGGFEKVPASEIAEKMLPILIENSLNQHMLRDARLKVTLNSIKELPTLVGHVSLFMGDVLVAPKEIHQKDDAIEVGTLDDSTHFFGALRDKVVEEYKRLVYERDHKNCVEKEKGLENQP